MGRLHVTLLLGILNWTSCAPTALRPARAVSEGEVEHVLSFTYPIAPDVPIPIPAYTLRYGVADSLDLGASIDGLSTVSVDATVQVLRRREVDLALGPQVTFNMIGLMFAVGPSLSAPVLLDLNLGPAVSLMAIAGPMNVDLGKKDRIWLLHAAGGLDVRITEGFSLRPHAGSYTNLSDPRGSSLPYLGLAFGFGGRRDFR